ncbi:ABC transporter substrate-binding protein [Acidisoma silvae]|uniref:ABC transporter substrate-binding protein n=1 Tax=Acidisoma silvae TaxID=2802396 RepID=A0A963YUW3_9PROT|nr:ABC transporter substrate-binding protein [Acidisoma silvae]MCB8877537.1 ABC transporter substrate-binding protein [Acidisoma silvae]
MKKTLIAAALASLSLVAFTGAASAKDLQTLGITVGSLGNPYYVALVKGATAEAKKINPNAQVTAVSADYDLNKQFTQIDNFIAKGVSMILVTAADQNAILPAIKRAQAAGITVIGVDVNAEGADAVVQTNNVEAGKISCAFLADKINHKGNVIIENGEQVSAVIDRVTGCKATLGQYPDIKIISDNENGHGSRDGAFVVGQGYFVRFSDIAGIFAVNDPQAIGTELAAKQAHRDQGLVITSVDGAPDIVNELKTNSAIQASASQDPYSMGEIGVKTGYGIMNGQKPAERTTLMAPKLITRENVDSYVGWTQH